MGARASLGVARPIVRARAGRAGPPDGLLWLGVAVIAAAALRFPTLSDQSYWRDEASTALELHGSLRHALASVRDFEGMPPTYFILAWLWTRVFGLGEAGLRSLSAVFGVLTVPVAWALARELKPQAAPLAAGLVATSPFLVWYSQEGRPYALLVLVTSVMTLFWVQDRRTAWGFAAAAALLTHYFAIFLVAPQALVLLRRGGGRALVAPVVTGLALSPLIASQTDARVDWITDAPLGSRMADVVKHFATGEFGTPVDALGVLAVLALAVGAALAGGRARALLAVAAVAAAGPVVFALLGADYVLDRYLIATLVPLLVVVAVGFARAPAAGLALSVLFTAFTITAAADRGLQREDWRDLARTVPSASYIVATQDGLRPLQWYLRGRLEPLGPSLSDTVLAVTSRRPDEPLLPTPPSPTNFNLAGRRDTPTTVAVRYRSPAPFEVPPETLVNLRFDPSASTVVMRVK